MPPSFTPHLSPQRMTLQCDPHSPQQEGVPSRTEPSLPMETPAAQKQTPLSESPSRGSQPKVVETINQCT